MTLAVDWSEGGARDGSSPLVSYTWKGQGGGKRKITVAWPNRHVALRQLLGYSYADASSGTRRLIRELPEPYQFDEGMFCHSARVTRGMTWLGRSAYTYPPVVALLPGYPNSNPEGGDYGTGLWKSNEFKLAEIEFDFMQSDFAIISDAELAALYGGNEAERFVSFRDDRSASYITLRQGSLYYITGVLATTDRSIPFTVGRIENKITLYQKWHQVAVEAVPWITIDGLIGKTNNAPVTVAGRTYAAGTLLFLPPKVDRYIMPNNGFGVDVEFVTDYFAEGWNKLFRCQAGKDIEYLYVTTDETIVANPVPGALPAKKFIYGEANFANAFDCSLP